MVEKIRCSVWKELCKIDFNFFNSINGKTEKINQTKFKEILLSSFNKNDLVIINGGHFIPSKKLSQNAFKTWKFACNIAKFLNDNKIKTSVSLLINDLPFTSEERTKLNLEIPNEYIDYAKNLGIQIINFSLEPNNPFTEKRCANRFSIQKKSKIWKLYPSESVYDYCVSAIIYYFRDIIKQGATKSIWITPKCSAQHLIDGINLFNQHEKKIDNFAYFYTNNCFE